MATTVVETLRADGWIQASFDGSAAESADLVADPGATDCYIEVKDLVVSLGAAGTVQFKGNATALTGAIPLASGTPLVIPSLHVPQGEKFNYTSVTGAAKGVFLYKVRNA